MKPIYVLPMHVTPSNPMLPPVFVRLTPSPFNTQTMVAEVRVGGDDLLPATKFVSARDLSLPYALIDGWSLMQEAREFIIACAVHAHRELRELWEIESVEYKLTHAGDES